MWFAEGKIHSKTLKHCFIKNKCWNRALLFWAGFAAWHIFGILTDNGAKHKFWDVVIFPAQPQWSLIAANLEIQQYKRQDLVFSASEFNSQSFRGAILHWCLTVKQGEIYLQKAKKKS